ncbi:MAG: sulfur carrier protein ThiS, partial [Methylobacter sp.]
MMIYVNGETRDYAENSRVADVVAELGLTGKKIAIELNKEILPFQQYDTQVLQAGDRLEIVHAIGGGQDDSFMLAGVKYHSRLLVGTGKYKDLEETRLAIEASGAQIVTVAIRRTNIGQNPGEPNLLDVISPDKYTILPNTAGCYTAEDAVRTCRLGRELLGGHNLVKLEVLADQTTLFPDVAETYVAAELLVKDGFDVMVYTNDDPIAAKRLENIGCIAVMPLAAPIGSGLGVRNPYNILTIVENATVPILVDAGVGTASDAAIAMELGCDGVLMNTAIAAAKNP